MRSISIALACALTPVAAAQDATFQGLGLLPDGIQNAPNDADDGTVVGMGIANATVAFVWTEADGIDVLPQPAGSSGAYARSLADGGRFIGGTTHVPAHGRWVPCVWTDLGAPALLGSTWGAVEGISVDGSVVVGSLDNNAVRWVDGGAAETLAPGGIAWDLTADGSIIVGQGSLSAQSGDDGQPFRWQNNVLMPLEMLAEDFPTGRAEAISADGTTMVGYALGENGRPYAVRWDADGTIHELGIPSHSAAHGVSPDGSVIVGRADDMGAFIWDQTNGARTLEAFLENEHGLDLTGWTLSSASGMSDDGTVITGTGERNGVNEGWVADLDALVDTDGDGLYDDWEENGVPYTDSSGTERRYLLDIDGDGQTDCDPKVPDLFVEVDTMNGLAPSGGAIGRVEAAFTASNIRLHVDLDETSLTVFGWTLDDTNNDGQDDWPTEFDSLKLTAASGTPLAGHFGTVAERSDPEAAAIRGAKTEAFRYCLFAKEQDPGNSTSGRGELPGNDFMVTLGLWGAGGGTSDQQAGTFMHELGHAIGLHHGGSDDTNFKPNYYSVMSYNWQTPKPWHVPGSWPLSANRRGYSFFALLSLDEAALDECFSMVGPVSSLAAVRFPHNTHDDPDEAPVVAHARYSDQINWNGGDCDLGVSVDVNRVRSGHDPSPGEPLPGHDDWSALVLGFRDLPTFAEGVHVTDSGDGLHELTFEEHQELEQILPAYCHGDINDDRVVDFADLIAVLGSLGACPDGCPADIEPIGFIDGEVTIDDLLAVLSTWGSCK